MLSLRLGRSRTCPMLALTTYREPRNLLIDLAFFGLSTMTSDFPLGVPAATGSVADFRFGAFAGAFEEVRLVVVLRVVLVSADGARSLGDLADLRATVS